MTTTDAFVNMFGWAIGFVAVYTVVSGIAIQLQDAIGGTQS